MLHTVPAASDQADGESRRHFGLLGSPTSCRTMPCIPSLAEEDCHGKEPKAKPVLGLEKAITANSHSPLSSERAPGSFMASPALFVFIIIIIIVIVIIIQKVEEFSELGGFVGLVF